MICKAVVVIFDKKQQEQVFIPCHRHCDAYQILKNLGYQPTDYKVMGEGFLDEHNMFYNRMDAAREAIRCSQLRSIESGPLYTEDLW